MTGTGEDTLPVLSVTQINKLYNCQRMWALEYIEDLKPPLSYPAVKGVFIHAAVERFNKSFSSLDLTEESNPRALLREFILDKARECWEEGYPGRFEPKMKQKNDEIREQLFNYVETLLNRYNQLNKQNFSQQKAQQLAVPTENELGITVTDEEGNWIFTGSIDCVYENSPLWNDRTVLIDYKTGKSPFNSEDPMKIGYQRQLNIYGWLYYQAFGEIPEMAGIQFLKESPTSSEAFLFIELDPGVIERMHLLIQRARQQLTSEQLDEYPRNPDFQWCRFEKNDGTVLKCDHWDYCLGDEKQPHPDDLNRMEIPYGEDPETVEIRDPFEEQVAFSEYQGAYFPRYNQPLEQEEIG